MKFAYGIVLLAMVVLNISLYAQKTTDDIVHDADQLYQSHKNAEAAIQYKILVNDHPKSPIAPHAKVRLAEIQLRMGNLDSAIATTDELVKRINEEQSDDDLSYRNKGYAQHRVRVLDLLLEISIKKGKYDKALEYLEGRSGKWVG